MRRLFGSWDEVEGFVVLSAFASPASFQSGGGRRFRSGPRFYSA